MAFANQHVKVTVFGTVFGGAEEWSTGFHMGSEDPGAGNFSINETWLAALLPLWQTFFTSATIAFHSTWKTVGIKAAIIKTDGKTDIDNVRTAAYGTPISGASASQLYPGQVSLVAQLAAASPVGLGAKGRMYLPATTTGVLTTGHISTTAAQDVANGLRTFLDGAESAANSPGYVMNTSQGRVSPAAAPVNRRVTTVRVGTVLDTQRRRRNGLTETYMSAALAA